MESSVATCRRQDDRRGEIPFLCAYHLGLKEGNRVVERRVNRGKAAYVDRYAGYMMFCSIAIVLLSGLDAMLTLRILAAGGEELNWFMAALLEQGTEQFVQFKIALTVLAVMLLAIHHNVVLLGKMRVKHIKYLTLISYSVLISYELYLLELAALG